jgi:hypothetical protein
MKPPRAGAGVPAPETAWNRADTPRRQPAAAKLIQRRTMIPAP